MKKWGIGIGISAIVCFAAGFFWMVTYIQNVGVPQVRMMQTLNSTNLDIGALGTNEQGHGLFLTRNNLPRTTQLLQERMSQQGWTYTGQEGSGYFFKKGRQTAVVTTRIIHRKFIQIQVQHNVVNIADPSTTNKTHSYDSLQESVFCLSLYDPREARADRRPLIYGPFF